MKSIIINFILAFLFSLSAHANHTPSQRNCLNVGGLPWVVYLTQGDIELCYFDSQNSSLGSFTLFSEKVLNTPQQAIATYKSLPHSQCNEYSTPDKVNYCAQHSGKVIGGKDSRELRFLLCQFNDGSTFELTTFCRGYGNPGNAKLDKQL